MRITLKNRLVIRWYNQNNLKRSINNVFVTISTHVYINSQNSNTTVYSILNSTRRLKTRWHPVLTDKNKNKEQPN